MNFDRMLNLAAVIFIPIILFLLTPLWTSTFKEQKELVYEIFSKSEIGGTFPKNDWPEIDVIYKGSPIETGGFVALGFKNTGTVPIRKEDFEKPITVTFDKESRVVDHRTIYISPENLKIQFVNNGNEIAIQPLLLNPEDSFSIELLVKGELDIKSVDARIFGIKEITKNKNDDKSGLYIEYVEEKADTSSSTHRQVTYLHTGFLFAVAVFLLTFAFISRVLRKEQNIFFRLIFDEIKFFMIYLFGLISSSLYAWSITKVERDFYTFANLLLPVFISLFLAIGFRKIFLKLKLASKIKAKPVRSEP